MRQVDGSLTPITAVYDEDAVGTLVYQYLNGTTTGLATFGPSMTTNPIYYNSDPPYTETIQATVTTPVYITGVEIGLPYGSSAPPFSPLHASCVIVAPDMSTLPHNMCSRQSHALALAGGIVAVRVKTPQGTWLPLYTGTPLHKLGTEQGTQYWKWPPEVCQLNFKSDEIRVEIDTSGETGILVSVVDYVKVIGTSEQQSAALPFVVGANNSLVYQVDPFWSGADSFTYAASDCPGQPSRMSAPATVDLAITPVNHAPKFWFKGSDGPPKVTLTVDVPKSSFSGSGSPMFSVDIDPFDTLTFSITKLPKYANMTVAPPPPPAAGGGWGRRLQGPPVMTAVEVFEPVVEGAVYASASSFPTPSFGVMFRFAFGPKVTMLTSVCEEDEFTYTVSDGIATTVRVVQIAVACPRPCSLSNDVDWEEGVCDQSTLTRELTANWRNYSSWNASDDNNTACDLPRAPYLPGTVKVDCDAIDLDSSWAVNLVVAGAVLATCKVGLLVHAIVHRKAPIYQKAQARPRATPVCLL